MPSRTFTIALERKLAHRQRLREARVQETQARERVVELMLQYAAFVYHRWAGLTPPVQMRGELMREVSKPDGAYAWLVASAKQNGFPFSMQRSPAVDRPTTVRHDESVEKRSSECEPVLIKRYAGRRFYDTVACRYVSRDEMAAMTRNGRKVVVQDAKTGEVVTSEVLSSATLTKCGR